MVKSIRPLPPESGAGGGRPIQLLACQVLGPDAPGTVSYI